MMYQYPIVIVPLSDEDGGGYLAHIPDLPGCMGDGATPEEAARDVKDAISAWIEERTETGREVPAPGSAAKKHRHERDLILSALKEAADRNDDIEQKVSELRRDIIDMQDNADNMNAWIRFSQVTRLPLPDHEQEEGHC